jgi:3-hydroxyisobutyrate dehydrogenase-like beta-hydroxyacid dehydrogenase
MMDAALSTSSVAKPPTGEAVGFVGLGRMGAPIAGRLLASGYRLYVTSRTREKAAPLVDAGATWCENPKEVAENVGMGLLFLMLPEAKDTGRVLSGRSGVLRRASAGLLVLDLSTSAPEECRAHAALLAERSVLYADCPVGGSVDAAEKGTLTVFAGGGPAELDRAEPALRTFAAQVERMGAVGSGAAMKLTNNLLTTGQLVLLGEALALGESMGLPRERLLSVLQSGGGRSALFEAKRPMLEAGEYPARFRLTLARKDAKLIERAAKRNGLDLLLAPAARRAYDRAVDAGLGEADFAAVVEPLRPKPAAPSPPTPPSPARDPEEPPAGPG